jgi:acyl dehydratase
MCGRGVLPGWGSGPSAADESKPRTSGDSQRSAETATHSYDEAVARASRFGAIIVQGGVTSAILNAVVAEDLPGPGTVFLHVDGSFRAPVRPGDVITGAVEVLSVREDKPVTEIRTTVTRDDGVLALDGTALCYTVPV